MRIRTFWMMSGMLAMGAAGAAAAMAPASGTIVLHATATFSNGSSADRLYEVKSDADSDGDAQGRIAEFVRIGSGSKYYFEPIGMNDSIPE